MVYEANFLVRKSGKRENSYYIDYAGSYTIAELSKIVGLKPGFIEEIYLKHGAAFDESISVYYFPVPEKARESITEILSAIKPSHIGKCVYLTNEEIEIIRQALINEGVNTIGTKNKLKDQIFRKLNDT
jgi:hypothetical protein